MNKAVISETSRINEIHNLYGILYIFRIILYYYTILNFNFLLSNHKKILSNKYIPRQNDAKDLLTFRRYIYLYYLNIIPSVLSRHCVYLLKYIFIYFRLSVWIFKKSFKEKYALSGKNWTCVPLYLKWTYHLLKHEYPLKVSFKETKSVGLIK